MGLFSRRDTFRSALGAFALRLLMGGKDAYAAGAEVGGPAGADMLLKGGSKVTRLFGRDYKGEELFAYVGQMAQVAGIQRFELTEGRAKGTECARVYTGSGFEFLVVPDRAMDIALASYKGAPLNWYSQAGIVAPTYQEPLGKGWDWTFFGGLNTTCGLTVRGARQRGRGRTARASRAGVMCSGRGRKRDDRVARRRVRDGDEGYDTGSALRTGTT